MDLIGRERECKLLHDVISSSKSEFVAIYGRRRIGKTFLVRQYFDHIDFQLTGMANVTTQQQLINFRMALMQQSHGSYDDMPDSWIQAFSYLKKYLSQLPNNRKKVIFLDELPWLDTPRSDFLPALEHFYNSWVSSRQDIILITCGSAASWMISKLIHSHGGLHNRVTRRIRLLPFTLRDTEAFLQHKGCVLDRYQILQLYMVMGGVPFYLDAIPTDQSATQIIDALCFTQGAILQDEYRILYPSLFKKPQNHYKVLETLASKSIGMSRGDITSSTGLSSGGGLSRILRELEENGFISRYVPFSKKTRDSLYRLSDFYTSFYLRFIHNNPHPGAGTWAHSIDNPRRRAWSGYAFEQVCLSHVMSVKKALGITGIYSKASAWHGEHDGSKAQIDLLIDRRDHVINLCEIKFSTTPYKITKAYIQTLEQKARILREATQTRKSIFLTMITTYGLAQNAYAGRVQHDFDMDMLFD